MADNLGETWDVTEHLPVAHQPLSDLDETSSLLIKKESRVRILLTASDESGQRICFKIYRFPGRLRWRTLFSAARVKREFENMVTARGMGVPVVEPVSWFEERYLGLQKYNAIATVYMPLKDMAQVLLELPEGDPRRFELIEAAGKLLARMHQSGVVWVTALPRNILVGDGRDPQLLAFDMPYGCEFDHSIEGSRSAAYDLDLFLRSGLNQSNFESEEAEIFLSAYCGDDHSGCRVLLRRLQNKTRLGHFMDRVFIRSLANIKASFRQLKPG